MSLDDVMGTKRFDGFSIEFSGIVHNLLLSADERSSDTHIVVFGSNDSLILE